VLYREVRRTDVVFVCRATDDTAAVIPAWMLDPLCADMVLGAPRASVRSLEQLRALLHELGFDRAGTTERERSQEEGRDEADAVVISRTPTAAPALPAAALDADHHAQREGSGQRHRRARPATSRGRAAAARTRGR